MFELQLEGSIVLKTGAAQPAPALCLQSTAQRTRQPYSMGDLQVKSITWHAMQAEIQSPPRSYFYSQTCADIVEWVGTDWKQICSSRREVCLVWQKTHVTVGSEGKDFGWKFWDAILFCQMSRKKVFLDPTWSTYIRLDSYRIDPPLSNYMALFT